MSEPIRWGILATGRIASDFTQDLALIPDAKAVAVASRSAEPAQRFADEHGLDRAHASWQALAEDPDVDVVYVGTPHNAHYAATKMMLEAGKPVLCEKPFTVSAAAARDLFEIADRNGVFLAEAMWMRVNPTLLRAVELVDQGAIGAIRLIQADFGIRAPEDDGHRLRNPELAGGALLDLGVYPVSFADVFLGTPSHIHAQATLTNLGVDETTGMLFGYGSGSQAALMCSIAASSPIVGTIIGETGYITLDSSFYKSQRLTLRPHGGEPVVEDHPYDGNGLRFQAIEVGSCLRDGKTASDLLTPAGTMSVMETMDRVRELIGVTYPDAVEAA
jgi:predicted dehydrogenase